MNDEFRPQLSGVVSTELSTEVHRGQVLTGGVYGQLSDADRASKSKALALSQMAAARFDMQESTDRMHRLLAAAWPRGSTVHYKHKGGDTQPSKGVVEGYHQGMVRVRAGKSSVVRQIEYSAIQTEPRP